MSTFNGLKENIIYPRVINNINITLSEVNITLLTVTINITMIISERYASNRQSISVCTVTLLLACSFRNVQSSRPL